MLNIFVETVFNIYPIHHNVQLKEVKNPLAFHINKPNILIPIVLGYYNRHEMEGVALCL